MRISAAVWRRHRITGEQSKRQTSVAEPSTTGQEARRKKKEARSTVTVQVTTQPGGPLADDCGIICILGQLAAFLSKYRGVAS